MIRQNNTVYGGNETSAGIFLHRSSDYAIVKSEFTAWYITTHLIGHDL